MAGPAIASVANAARGAFSRFAPDLAAKAQEQLRKVTSGRVSTPADVIKYVGNNSSRLSVVTDALVRAGAPVDAIFPSDIVATDSALAEMRKAASELATKLQGQFDNGAGTDRVLPSASPMDAAADVFRIRRVKAALSIYGTEENYFLCHPSGGIPADDFAHVRAIQKALYRR